ncbi:MAG: hypothetical protein Q8Q65_04785 [bacterium]|nr:hypothetical protein [bacterium]
MSTLLKPLLVREKLLERKMRIFTFHEFSSLFPSSRHNVKYFLEHQVEQGLLTRIKRGLYTLKTDPPSEEEIANALYRPSYISFEYALAYYNLLPEMPYHLTSATTKPTRLFILSSNSFSYRTIKTEAYTGYRLVEQGEIRYLIAEPEKALVDSLYFASLSRTTINERIFQNYKLKTLNKAKVSQYAKLYQQKKLDTILGNLL